MCDITALKTIKNRIQNSMPSIQSIMLGNFDKNSFPVEGSTCCDGASTVKLQCRGVERRGREMSQAYLLQFAFVSE